jgi:hypothetical protein
MFINRLLCKRLCYILVTEFMLFWVQAAEALYAGGGVDPSFFAPPSCHTGVAKSLTEQSGGTFSPAKAAEILSPGGDASVNTPKGGTSPGGTSARHAFVMFGVPVVISLLVLL